MNALTASLPALRLHFAQFASSWLARLDASAPPAPEALPPPTHVLHPLETLWVDTPAGESVTCLDGCVLLQFQGPPRADVILVRGESHAFGSGARVAVQAYVATALRIA
jgi:hypothetical protein